MNVGIATLTATGGWNFQIPALTLSVGQHLVTAIAVGRGRPAPLGEGKPINVTAPSFKVTALRSVFRAKDPLAGFV
jgi:hypothetical protein